MKQVRKAFTLIEVVIVLAIVALIIIIVFLAVSGVQRSQRDNAAKSGASRALAAAQTYLSDNKGVITLSPAEFVTDSNLDGGVTNSGNFGKYFKGVVGHDRRPFQLSITPVGSISDPPRILFSRICNGAGDAMTDIGASPTSFAVVYWSESANSPVCIDS